MDDVRAAIAALPGSEGWWHASGQEDMEQVASELRSAGLEPQTIIDVLTRVYGAVANEYGD